MKKYLPLLLFLIIFIFESLFVQFLPGDLFHGEKIVAPRFLIISLIFFAIYGNEKLGIIYGFIFGVLFDIVYTEILGVYLFLFPLITYIVIKIMRIVQINIFTVSFFSLFGVVILEFAVYEMNKIIGITAMGFSSFLTVRFFPTLLLNVIFTVIAAYPLKRQFENFADYMRAD